VNSLDYNLGVIGLGHWFTWLETGLGERGSLKLKKAVGTKSFDEKKDLLLRFNIQREDYYISGKDGWVDDSFFDGIDIVHISDPNQFHAKQAMESLMHGKVVVTEKTLAINKKEFDTVSTFIRQNNLQSKIYLHLHYLHKQPSIAFKTLLPSLIKDNGKIRSIEATFFEEVDEEDPKRTWVLAPYSGGIFMDWIHPYEVIFYTTRCNFGKIKESKDFCVNENYDKINPTGVEALVELDGENYAQGATALVRVAKGAGAGYENKSLKFVFESGNYAMLCFPGHEAEFNNPNERGRIQLFEKGTGKILMSQKLTGSNTSMMFIKEVLDLCEGNNRGLKLDEISEIFRPQWDYQAGASSRTLIKDEPEVKKFLENGLQSMKCR
jgi:predicted dehydrogenase